MPTKQEIWQAYKSAIINKLNYSDVYSDVKQQRDGNNGWITGLCPLHRDSNPSFAFHKEKLNWVCFSGCGKGSVFDYVSATSGNEFKYALYDLGNKLGIPNPFSNNKNNRYISEAQIDTYVKALELNPDVKQYLREKRGIQDSTIRDFKIGWDVKRQRNSLPVRDHKGDVVNIRLYNAEKKPKMLNYTDGDHRYGSPARLFPLEVIVKGGAMESDYVIITEGEWDALILIQEGFVAVTGTAGCQAFRQEWLEYFKGKHIVIIYDCDAEGQRAVNEIVLPAFANSGDFKSIKNVILPLSGDKDSKDITDFFVKRGFTRDDLRTLIDKTKPVNLSPKKKTDDIETIKLESFVEVENKKYIDKHIEVDVCICGETSDSFHAVEEFQLKYCQKQNKGECNECPQAPHTVILPKGAQEFIGSCMSTNVQVTSMLRFYLCKHNQKPAVEVSKKTTIKEFFCHQRMLSSATTNFTVSDDGVVNALKVKQEEPLEKKVYYLGHDWVKPGNYKSWGWVKTHPKTQQITYLIEKLLPLEEDYQSFRVERDNNFELLKAFGEMSIQEKLDDLSENVTRVYERDEVLLALLLTYFCPLRFVFNNSLIRGWIVSCCIGDSGTGKTQSYLQLSSFLKIGDTFSAVSGSRTGLAYAMVEHPLKGWNIKIGRYPANSRRLLIVDEVQVLDPSDLQAIAKAIEEGHLEVKRVIDRTYESMTRMIIFGNPKWNRVMDTYTWGCECLSDLFTPMIIRRLDFVVLLNSSDISDPSLINKRILTQKQRLTSDIMRAALFWVWNLEPEDIVFESDAQNACLNTSTVLESVFGKCMNVPLLQLSDIRNKVARIATAFACLELSSDSGFKKLYVKAKHVLMAERFLGQIYTAKNCSLNLFSQIEMNNSQLVGDYSQLEESILKKRENEKHSEHPYFMKLMNLFYFSRSIKREELVDQSGASSDTVKGFISFLRGWNLIDSNRSGYFKKPRFVKFFQNFCENHPQFFDMKQIMREHTQSPSGIENNGEK